ncbi:SLATT domain-containing protein [uncultured Microscilla sp.]|uniref:SLATT domain-containing protein n=1 Tax=uncultured Microscilla sp. TaxID=432653 RepID=UPI00260596E4|nr:SLATT domain-containing protein [uncultured Microscilla sp.]
MVEDNPTNPDSGDKKPTHDPFDMLKGDTPTGNTPPPEKEENKEEDNTENKQETSSTTGSDPFDMVEKHPTSGTPPSTPTVNTGGDPFDMVEKHPTSGTTTPITNTSDPLNTTGQPSGSTSQPNLPKPSEDPLIEQSGTAGSASQPNLPQTPLTEQSGTPTGSTPQPNVPNLNLSSPPPPNTSIPTPTATPVPNPQPIPNIATPPPDTHKTAEREAYQSKLDMNAVLAAANKVNQMPKLQATSMEKLDEALFTKRHRTKVGPEEKEEVEQKLQYLVNKIKKDLAFYNKKEQKSGKWTLIFSVLSSLLAASVTVLLGLNITDFMRKHNFDWYINTIALIISAFISVIGVLQNFTDSKPLWVKYTDTSNKYQQLLDNIEYMQLAGNYITLDDVNQIKLAYNRIKDGTNNYIIQVRSQDDGTGNSSLLRS